VPASWHWSLAVHVTGLAPTQLPFWQLSACVHESPSEHVAPSSLAGLEHSPVAGSHVPASWHSSLAAHVTGLAPTHVPPWQVSVCVHRLPSEQAAPLFLAGLVHCPLAGSHTPASWHWSLAAQTTGAAPKHVPAWQVSAWVQALPSLQEVPLVLGGSLHSPVEGLQVPASWHWSLAVQSTGLVPWHTPA
jgi:hypothetical protein